MYLFFNLVVVICNCLLFIGLMDIGWCNVDIMCYNMNNFYWRVLFFYGILYEFLKVNSLLVSCKLLKLK